MRSNIRAYPACERRQVHRAGLTRHFAAAFENRERGNAADLIARGGLRRLFGVELRKARMRLQLRGRTLVMRCHHPARTAPRGPEIDDDRHVAPADVQIELAIADFDGFTHEKRAL